MPVLTTPNHYQTLGIPQAQWRTSTADDLKKIYRKLALKCHPDKNKDDPTAKKTFQAIQEAYDTLSDPQKRREYDLKLFPPSLNSRPAPQRPQSSTGSRSYPNSFSSNGFPFSANKAFYNIFTHFHSNAGMPNGNWGFRNGFGPEWDFDTTYSAWDSNESESESESESEEDVPRQRTGFKRPPPSYTSHTGFKRPPPPASSNTTGFKRPPPPASTYNDNSSQTNTERTANFQSTKISSDGRSSYSYVSDSVRNSTGDKNDPVSLSDDEEPEIIYEKPHTETNSPQPTQHVKQEYQPQPQEEVIDLTSEDDPNIEDEMPEQSTKLNPEAAEFSTQPHQYMSTPSQSDISAGEETTTPIPEYFDDEISGVNPEELSNQPNPANATESLKRGFEDSTEEEPAIKKSKTESSLPDSDLANPLIMEHALAWANEQHLLSTNADKWAKFTNNLTTRSDHQMTKLEAAQYLEQLKNEKKFLDDHLGRLTAQIAIIESSNK
ncbi:similar to Saccharomyces cerevisiae YER048C CAJ1 Nuclear type II J heat shock protein of the E. coli dnaJ family [Geotrichum candidum]|uniref:Similar to Saccharomyces cerevisiae YER048C CAJ1 Nuclear type II J heat shock protein of the E. coli dnaJ family n=1 Tax=Geotrichum candidum TaxID=1173061 RepID=A0A0J9XA54_GEOCN|nr:similar to Saccharomyces cerevisiae YER048C CAJ1 Nuclear type II J heat shock protein of the E. coli dnaJ family [Geotrichum candidum]